jgi:phytoene synthase
VTTKDRPYAEYAQDVALAKSIHRRHGKSYYFATRWLPRKAREATHILYAWLRIPDDWVDSDSLSLEKKMTLLADWEAQWNHAQSGATTPHPILRSAAYVFREYDFADEWGRAFLCAMRQDLVQKEYETYADLAHYMHGSAGVVGQMMCRISGADPRALPYAELNGYAMQLTNFLRDVGEDYRLRDRIYLPREDREQFGVTTQDLAAKDPSPALIELLKHYSQKTRSLYAAARPGISYVNKPGQLPFRLASTLYGAILDKIAGNAYNVLTKRAHTSLREKLLLAFREL